MPATTNQDHFRVRTDATAAEGGTPVWAAAQDTSVSLAVSTNFRIRFAFSNTGSNNSTSTKNLFVSRNSGAYAQVTTSTTFAQTVDTTAGASSNNSAITTQLLTGVGTFSGAGVYNDTGTTTSIAQSGGTCNEFEFGIVITASASTGDTYDFRIYPNGTVVNGAYNQTPRITVVAGGGAVFVPYSSVSALTAILAQPDPGSAIGSAPFALRRLPPAITAVPVNNPPVRTNPTHAAVAVYGWQPGPAIALSIPNISVGIEVDSPPASIPSRNSGSEIIPNSWLPDPAAWEFFGGRGPFMPARLPPSQIAVAVNNPPVSRSQDKRPYDNWWISSDPSPQLSVKLAQGPPQWIPGGNNDSIAVVLSTWAPGIPVALSAGQIVAGVEVDNPPIAGGFSSTPALTDVLGSWQAADPTPAIRTFLPVAGVISPRFPTSATSEVILAAWTPGQLEPLSTVTTLHDVEVDAPPVSSNSAFQNILASWAADVSPIITGRRLPPLPVPPAFVPSNNNSLEIVLASWSSSDPLPILPRYAVRGVAANNPPFGVPSLAQRTILESWQPAPAQAPIAGFLDPAISAVPVNNPPFGIPSKSAQAILPAWTPPDAQAPAARALNPAFSAVVVSQPPVSSSADNQLASGGTWPALPDPLPILPRYLPAVVTGVAVNNPPFGLPRQPSSPVLGAWVAPDAQAPVAGNLNPAFSAVAANVPPPSSRAADALIAGGAWPALPDPNPTLPRYLPATITGVLVNTPPVSGGALQNALLAAWLPSDPAPIVSRPGPPQAAAAGFIPARGVPTAILAAWVPADPAPVLARPLNPAFEAVIVNNPPPKGAVNLTGAWVAADFAPIVPRYLPQGAPSQVASMPFQVAIAASWIAPDPLPTVARPLNPVFSAVRVDNPPSAQRGQPLAISVTWVSPDPSPQLPRTVPQGIVAATFLPSPQVTVPELFADWVVPDPQAPTARPLNPVFEAVAVTNPPGRRPDRLASIVAAWVQDDLAPRALAHIVPAAPAPFVPAETAAFETILAGWIPADFVLPVNAKLPQPVIQLPPIPTKAAQLAIVASWAAPDPQVSTPRSLSVPASIDNPPRRGGSFATVLASWAEAPALFSQRPLQVPLSFVVPPAASNFETTLNSWADASAPVVFRQNIPQGVRVDFPPISSKILAQEIVVDIWLAPTGLLPTLRAITMLPPGLPLAVDPRYMIHYPSGTRIIHYFGSARTINYPYPPRIINYPHG